MPLHLTRYLNFFIGSFSVLLGGFHKSDQFHVKEVKTGKGSRGNSLFFGPRRLWEGGERRVRMEMSSCFSFWGVIWGSSSGGMVCGGGALVYLGVRKQWEDYAQFPLTPVGFWEETALQRALLGGRSSVARQNKDLAGRSLGFLIPYIEAEWTHS